MEDMEDQANGLAAELPITWKTVPSQLRNLNNFKAA
jgi:hypothetical protein